ncbi:MAG TPA: polysaccharide deacetylase family protein [Caldilineaceae bacterium]|nr:polysaccharide deacetylase family protein [Caldilineaceae bacterium]
MSESYFVLTDDDPGMKEPERFAELLDFLKVQEVPATFFVVPFAGDLALDQKPEWVALLQRALEEGHELQHHGWTHNTPFEFGVPPYFMLDIIPDAKTRWHDDPAPIQATHSYQTLRDKLMRGREILERTFGYTPRGFRSPCLGVCDNLYTALHDLGFEWSTNQVINPLGWRYINRDYDYGEPWATDFPSRPFRHSSGVVEAPMHSEYTWFLETGDVDRHFELARADFDRARRQGQPFIALSHYYAMTGQWATGLRLYERLFDYARAQGDVHFVTLGQLLARQPV